jgi:hypothetical protein
MFTWGAASRRYSSLLIVCFMLCLSTGMAADAPNYPIVDIEGFREFQWTGLDILPGSDPVQYKSDPAYNNIPSAALARQGLQNRFHLDIEGKLNENLSVKYHLVQEPDLPEVYDIEVNYDKWQLKFGKNLQATFKSGDFIALSKQFDGVRLSAQYDNFDLLAAVADEKSVRKEVTFSGGQKEYKLGNANILDGSVLVYKDDVVQKAGVDYTVDYFSGTLTFAQQTQQGSTIRVNYEFTNPIEDFLPVGSNKRFMGVQGNVRVFDTARPVVNYQTITKVITFPKDQALAPALIPQWLMPLKPEVVTGNSENSIRLLTQPGVEKVTLKIGDQDYYFTNQGIVKDQAVWLLPSFGQNLGPAQIVVSSGGIDTVLSGEMIKTPDGFNWETKAQQQQLASFRILNWTPELKSGEVFKLNLETQALLSSVYVVDPKNNQIKGSRQEGAAGNFLWNIEFKIDETLAPGIQNFVLYALDENGKIIQTTLPVKISLPDRDQFLVRDYVLPESYLQPESLIIKSGDQKLNAGSDYDFDPALRKIIFKNINLKPDQQINIDYVAVNAVSNQEKIMGDGSTGPYLLSKKPIAPGSLELTVDNVSLKENDHYSIDYEQGRIQFNTAVFGGSVIGVQYKTLETVMKVPQAKTPKLEIGGSFLQETAKAAASQTEKAQQETLTARSATVNGVTTYYFTTSKFPIVGVNTLLLDGVAQTTANYELQNYRGYIIPTPNSTVTPGSQIIINYRYLDPVVASPLSFSIGSRALDASYAPPQVQPIQSGTLVMFNDYPSALPMSYKSLSIYIKDSQGIERLLAEGLDYYVGDHTRLSVPSVSIQAEDTIIASNSNAYEYGLITFVTQNGIYLERVTDWNKIVPAGSSLKVIFKKSPTNISNFGEIVHQVYDVHAQYQINENWQVYTDVAQSRLAYERATATTQNIFNVTSSNIYQLIGGITNEVVENSEKVFVVDTDSKVTPLQKDEHYFINYVNGVITIRPQVTLGTNSQIRVQFEYFNQAAGVLTKQEDTDIAIASRTKGRVGDFILTGGYINQGKKFNPIGSTFYTPGTIAYQSQIDYAQPNNPWSGTAYLENREVIAGKTIQSGTDLKQNTGFQKLALNYKNNDLNRFYLSYQNKEVVQRSSDETVTTHSINTRDFNYELGAGLGTPTLNAFFIHRHQESLGNFIDKDLAPENNIFDNYYQLKNNYLPWNFLKLSSDLQANLTERKKALGGTTARRYGALTAEYTPLKYFFTNLSLSAEQIEEENLTTLNATTVSRNTKLVQSHSLSTTLTRPDFLNDDFTKELYIHDNFAFLQTDVPAITARPDTEVNNQLNVSLYPLEFAKTRLNLRTNNRDRVDGKDLYDLSDFGLALENIRPLKYFADSGFAETFFMVDYLKLNVRDSNQYNRIQSTATSENNTFADYNSFEQKYALNPLPKLTATLTHLNIFDKNLNQQIVNAGTANVLHTQINNPNRSLKTNVVYDPDDLTLPLIGWKYTQANFSYAYENLFSENSTDVSNTSLVSNNSFSIRKSDKNNHLFLYRFQPSNEMRYKGTARLNSELYTNSSTPLSRFTDLSFYDLSLEYQTPITNLVFNGYLAYNGDSQKSAPTANFTQSDLNLLANSILERSVVQKKAGLGYTPFAELTLYSNAAFIDIAQNTSPNLIKQMDLSIGSTYRPFAGMLLDYAYIKKIFNDSLEGTETVLKAKYEPFEWPVGKIIFSYERRQHNGKGLNDITQLINQNRELGIISSSITDRDDVKQVGTLLFELTNQINSEVIEEIKLDASWTLIDLQDYITRSNSYKVAAYLLRGTIFF